MTGIPLLSGFGGALPPAASAQLRVSPMSALRQFKETQERQVVRFYKRVGIFSPVFRYLPLIIYGFLGLWIVVVLYFTSSAVYKMLVTGQPLANATWTQSAGRITLVLVIGFLGACLLAWGARRFRSSYALYETRKKDSD